MNIKTHIREALQQLKASKLRSFLAVLGILVGSASVVAMISFGQLSQAQILSQFKALGMNLLSVSIYPKNYNSKNANPFANLNIQEATNINKISNNIWFAAPYVNTYGNLIYNGHALQGSTDGITPEMFKIAKLKLHMGRELSFLDKKDYFCVIGHNLYQKMQSFGVQNPIGKQIQVGNNMFTVVGVLQKWPMNFFFSTDFNQAVLVPIATAMALQKNAKIQNVAIRLRDTNKSATTRATVKKYIENHTLQQRVTIRSPKSIAQSFEKTSETTTILLGVIGSISLIVGGIGIMNIMLVSVAERHKEIGIRLAIGAKQSDIQMQFMIESVVLSLFGGIVGTLSGVLISYIISLIKGWHFSIFITPPILGAVVTIAVGVFFGFYPARKASKLDPIETLRSS